MLLLLAANSVSYYITQVYTVYALCNNHLYYRTTDVNTKPSGEGKAKPGTQAVQSQSSKSYLLSLALFETSFIANIVSVELGSHCRIFAVDNK